MAALRNIVGATSFTTRDVLFTVIGSGLGTHLIFKRWEPGAISAHVAFLIILPSVLSTLQVNRLSVISAVATTFAAFYASLVLSVVTYRLGPFHPLARYPGPILCKLSKVWMAYIANKGKQHVYIQNLHARYGDFVRIGPNEISIRDTSAINPVMGSQGLPKGPNWRGRSLQNPVRSLIALLDPAEHLRRRKTWNRALNTAAIKEMQPALISRVTQLVDLIGKHKRVVDLSRAINFFTYDFMCDMAFGGGSETMRDGDPQSVIHKLEAALDTIMVLDHVPWVGHYAKKFPRAAEGYLGFRRMAASRIEARHQGGAHMKDLMYYITNEDIEDARPPLPQIITDGILAIIAGSDTTASVLSNVFYCLMAHRSVYQRLQAEVDHFYPSRENSLDTKHYHEMSYLEAVINETLRLYPAVPSGSQRAAYRGSGGKLIGTCFLPEGNQVRVHFWSIHRDPRNFSNPDAFWPERWLIAEGLEGSLEKLTHNINAFIPFSHGPANCAGKQLAMTEMRMVVCHVIQKLNLRFADGYDSSAWLRELNDAFVFKKGSLPVQVERRD